MLFVYEALVYSRAKCRNLLGRRGLKRIGQPFERLQRGPAIDCLVVGQLQERRKIEDGVGENPQVPWAV